MRFEEHGLQRVDQGRVEEIDPIAGFVRTAIAAAQSFQALIGVPARVEVDVFVNRVLAVAVNGSRSNQVVRRSRWRER